jgi:hypothetical protein
MTVAFSLSERQEEETGLRGTTRQDMAIKKAISRYPKCYPGFSGNDSG